MKIPGNTISVVKGWLPWGRRAARTVSSWELPVPIWVKLAVPL